MLLSFSTNSDFSFWNPGAQIFDECRFVVAKKITKVVFLCIWVLRQPVETCNAAGSQGGGDMMRNGADRWIVVCA